MMRFHALQFVAEKCAFNDSVDGMLANASTTLTIPLFFFIVLFFVEREFSTNLMALLNSFPAFESFIWISCSY